MIDNRTRILIASIRKLSRREAWKNIQRILGRAHTADIAAVIEGLDSEERAMVLKLENAIGRRAEIFSFLPRRIQIELLAHFQKTEIASLVGMMSSDDAADLLRDLQEDVSKEILNSMVKEDKEEVVNLLRYPEDTAGALMSSDMLALKESLMVSEAIVAIQNEDPDSLIAFYVYVVDESGKLVGVVSLKELILSKPHQLLKEQMSTDVISVRVETTPQEVARVVERYDFLAVPVVDETHTLVGVITVNDVIDVIREEAQEDILALGQVTRSEVEDFSLVGAIKARLPSLMVNFLGGSFCFLIIYYVLRSQVPLTVTAIVAMTPLILAVSETIGNQSSALAMGALRSGRIDLFQMGSHMFEEVEVNLILGAAFGSLMTVIILFVTGSGATSISLGLILFLQLLLAATLGNLIPILLSKMQVDPAARTISVLTVVSNILSILFLYGLVLRQFGERVAAGING